MKKKTTLESIWEKYCSIEHNENNYSIGGGLAQHEARTIDNECAYCGSTDGHYAGCPRPSGVAKFASRRHEDAKYDSGKLTLGEATQLFKKATGLDINVVREIIEYAVPNMEWHHAGKLPKAYGGGMKKTWFVNAAEICDIATNWSKYVEKLELSKAAEKKADEERKGLEKRKLDFLLKNAIKVERAKKVPEFFYLTEREMEGKYGWFDSTNKSYNLPEYFSGWKFQDPETYLEFLDNYENT